ncbi:MAG: hypothetical protein PHT78_08155 [Desulfitobacteriaceae bacterium]|nr:hypothetical protein [Desulfitobacteriaceae bacterium]MDD4753202.1 hypothetical protein [Desulfitobacteriaceae bacterium]
MTIPQVGLLQLKGLNLILSVCFFLGSIVISIFYDISWYNWFQSLTENITLVALVITVPFLSLPIAKGSYETSLTSFYEKYVKSEASYLGFTTFLSYLLALFVNIAAVPLVFELVDTQYRKYPLRITAAAVTRGFTAATIWAPNVISMGIILHYLPVAWHELVFGAIMLSFVALLAGFILEHPTFSYYKVKNFNESYIEWKKIWELLFTGSLLIGGILILSRLLELSVVAVVPLVSLTFPVLWALGKKRKEILMPEFKKYFFSLPRFNREVVIFTAAGCFAQAVSASSFDQVITNIISFLDFLPLSIFNLGILLLIILSSVAGIHPIISVTVLITAINPSLTGLSLQSFCYLLLAGWSLGIAVSPVGTCNVLTAARLNEEAGRVGTLGNLKYSVIVSFFVAVLLSLLPQM